jgi:tetratricopeptide (TPR) repeat protein
VNWKFLALAAAMMMFETRGLPQGQLSLSKASHESRDGAASQASFLLGLSLLHNFEYPRAAQAFREAQAADPAFVMAYWGEAMSYNHPLWMEQDPEAARAVLARLGATTAERLSRARNGRERAYLDAVEVLYGLGRKEDRDIAYSKRMAELAERYPEDVDARALYALSLLGLAHQGRDYALYMRAAAVLEELYPENLKHPGVLHYLIHSYDDPIHAPLGLRAARRYPEVAPDAPHALHMTSHIFLMRGMWDDVIASNEAASAAARRLDVSVRQAQSSCGHFSQWLVYGLNQRHRNAEARKLTEACRREAISAREGAVHHGSTGADSSSVTSWADMAIRGAIETGERPLVDGLGLSDSKFAGTQFTLAYADLIIAETDLPSTINARSRLMALDRLLAARSEPPQARRRRAVILVQASAMEMLRGGDVAVGLAELRRAAELERAVPIEAGPPLVEKPSFELLGDELRRRGRLSEAQEAYSAALSLAPGRRLSSRD